MQTNLSRQERIGFIVKHAEAIIGKTLSEVIEMDHDIILETLGRDLVGDRLRAATVTLDTAKMAARKYLAREV